MPDDEVAAAVVERFPGTVFVDSHGQPVVYVAARRRGTTSPRSCATSSSSRSAST